MRVLWVTPQFPEPGRPAEAAEQFALLRSIAVRHDITVVTTDWTMRREALDAVGELGVRVRAVPWPMEVRPRSRASRLVALLRSDAASVAQAASRRRLEPLRRALMDEHRARPVDLVCIIGDLAPVADAIDAPTALLLLELYSRRGDPAGERRMSLREVRIRLERRKALRWEKKWYARAEGIACVSDGDAALVSTFLARPVNTIAGSTTTSAAGEELDLWWRSIARERRSPSTPPRPSPSRPTASIVLCTRERPELLRRSLSSVGRAAASVPGTEVIIVEQGRPGAAAVADDAGVTATIVTDDGSGVSRARNIGARRARGEVVLYTDDDCEVPGDWVPEHLDVLADPEVVASFGEVAALTKWGEGEFDPARPPARHRHGSPPWLIGHSSNMAVRKTALFSVGGFDERMGPGSVSRAAGEDADLIVRLLGAGGILASGTGAPVRHIEWRSAAEHASMIVAYEHGAGVWIGKALRNEPRTALSFLRWRLGQLRDFAATRTRNDEASVSVPAFAGALARGLMTGLRMGRWRDRSTSA